MIPNIHSEILDLVVMSLKILTPFFLIEMLRPRYTHFYNEIKHLKEKNLLLSLKYIS